MLALAKSIVVIGGSLLTGLIVISLLVAGPSAAVISAVISHDDAQAQTRVNEKEDKMNPTPQPPRIAIVEDDHIWQSFLPRRLTKNLGGTSIVVYGDCNSLITELSGSPGLNYDLYLVDNGLPDTTGPLCITQIRVLRPMARFLGISGTDLQKNDFSQVGVDIFTKRQIGDEGGIQKITDLIKQLLPH